jgi:hypothetical protein
VGETTATVAIPNAAKVVAGMRPGFRSRYNQGLVHDPTISGRVTLTAKVLPSGEVDSVAPSGNTGLSDPLVNCLIRKLRNAEFDPPGPKGSTLKVPLTFTSQQQK